MTRSMQQSLWLHLSLPNARTPLSLTVGLRTSQQLRQLLAAAAQDYLFEAEQPTARLPAGPKHCLQRKLLFT